MHSPKAKMVISTWNYKANPQLKWTPNYQEFQRRYKRVRIRISIGTDTQAHSLSLSDKVAFVIVGGVHHAPESSVDDLIENRRGIKAVDPSVEVGGPDEVLGCAVHGDDVAELVVEIVSKREWSDGGECRNEDRDC